MDQLQTLIDQFNQHAVEMTGIIRQIHEIGCEWPAEAGPRPDIQFSNGESLSSGDYNRSAGNTPITVVAERVPPTAKIVYP